MSEVHSNKQSIPAVHILRGLTALFITLYHFLNYADFRGSLFNENSTLRVYSFGGYEAVHIFFVISGFIIPWALANNKYSIRAFPMYIWKRFIRIQPPYIVTILLIIFLKWGFELYNHMPLTIEPLRWIAHFFYSIPFTSYTWLNDIFWTLGIEMQYYIFIGFIFPLLNHSNETFRYLPIMLMLGLCYILPDERIFTFFAVPFSIGFLFYFLKTNKITTINFVVFSLALLLFNYFILHANFWQIGFILIACSVLFFEKPIWKLLTHLGDISYSFYLTHGLSGGTFLYFTQYRVHSIEAKLSLFIAALGISLLFATIFYRFIEVPSRKWASSINWR